MKDPHTKQNYILIMQKAATVSSHKKKIQINYNSNAWEKKTQKQNINLNRWKKKLFNNGISDKQKATYIYDK